MSYFPWFGTHLVIKRLWRVLEPDQFRTTGFRLTITNPGCLRHFHTTIFPLSTGQRGQQTAQTFTLYTYNKKQKQKNSEIQFTHTLFTHFFFTASRGTAGLVWGNYHTFIVVLVPVFFSCQRDNLRAVCSCRCRLTPHGEIWFWNYNIPFFILASLRAPT